jgi:hypothetical protein
MSQPSPPSLRCPACGREYEPGPDEPWRCVCGHPLEFAARPLPAGGPPAPTQVDTGKGLWTFAEFLPVRRGDARGRMNAADRHAGLRLRVQTGVRLSDGDLQVSGRSDDAIARGRDRGRARRRRPVGQRWRGDRDVRRPRGDRRRDLRPSRSQRLETTGDPTGQCERRPRLEIEGSGHERVYRAGRRRPSERSGRGKRRNRRQERRRRKRERT